MSKVLCMECRKPVGHWDVYIEYAAGNLCSSCVLQLGVSVLDCQALRPSQVDLRRASPLIAASGIEGYFETSRGVNWAGDHGFVKRELKEARAHNEAMALILKSA